MEQEKTQLQQAIIEQEKLSVQLRDALLFAESIVETVREALVVLDADLRVKHANQAFYRTFQINPAEIEGQLLFELDNGQWNIPLLRELLEKLLPQNTHFEDFEVEHNFPRIGRRTMLLNARRLYKEKKDETQMILLAIEDVTAQKIAKVQLDHYVRKLEWSNRELQDFAYISSHDLQEPLRAIQAFSERLNTKYAANLDEQGVDYLQRIQNAAGRMRVLITDLLAYSRVTTKANPFAAVDLTQVVQGVISDLSNFLDETSGVVELGDLPVIEADASQMRQLFQNLIANALKFHRKDEPPLIKIYESPSHMAPFADSAAKVHLIVEDSGIGFEQKYAERIFSPFERLHGQREYAGTGIGLAICRKIVERHTGSIIAFGTPHEGARFEIVLPRKAVLQENLQ